MMRVLSLLLVLMLGLFNDSYALSKKNCGSALISTATLTKVRHDVKELARALLSALALIESNKDLYFVSTENNREVDLQFQFDLKVRTNRFKEPETLAIWSVAVHRTTHKILHWKLEFKKDVGKKSSSRDSYPKYLDELTKALIFPYFRSLDPHHELTDPMYWQWRISQSSGSFYNDRTSGRGGRDYTAKNMRIASKAKLEEYVGIFASADIEDWAGERTSRAETLLQFRSVIQDKKLSSIECTVITAELKHHWRSLR